MMGKPKARGRRLTLHNPILYQQEAACGLHSLHSLHSLSKAASQAAHMLDGPPSKGMQKLYGARLATRAYIMFMHAANVLFIFLKYVVD